MSKGKLLAICLVWLVVAGALAVAYRLVLKPSLDRQRIARTSSASNYAHQVVVGFRSEPLSPILLAPRFHEELSRGQIHVTWSKNVGNDKELLRKLRDGDINMSVMSLAGFLRGSAELGETPATIVAVLEESQGGVALIAQREGFSGTDQLNRPEVRFVVGQGTYGETLVRVVMAHFQLDRLPSQPMETVPDDEAVFARYRQAKATDPLAFALREPFVSRVVHNPQMRVLADSHAFRGYLARVLVVARDFQVRNPEVVQDFLAAYFKTVYAERERMASLVEELARTSGTPVTSEEAQKIAKGTWCKNTLENLAHFGIEPAGGIPLLEDMIHDVTAVLARTGALAPTFAFERPADLYYDQPLCELVKSGFHPGTGTESLRSNASDPPELTEAKWNELSPLGTLAVSELTFARGTDRLTASSQESLKELVTTLQKFPLAYLRILGNADTHGDAVANQALAEKRAQAAAKFLVENGIHPHRVRAEGGTPSGRASVSFVLGQVPY